MNVKIKKLNPNAVMPTKAHTTDAGFDLTATSRTIDEYGNIVYGTGLAFEIPEGYAGYIFPRSSISKQDMALTNSVGVIDSGYRGEVMAKFKMAIRAGMLKKKGVEEHYFAHTVYPGNRVYDVGDRIGQLIIMPLLSIELEEATELSTTSRGTGGYGSSGK